MSSCVPLRCKIQNVQKVYRGAGIICCLPSTCPYDFIRPDWEQEWVTTHNKKINAWIIMIFRLCCLIISQKDCFECSRKASCIFFLPEFCKTKNSFHILKTSHWIWRSHVHTICLTSLVSHDFTNSHQLSTQHSSYFEQNTLFSK